MIACPLDAARFLVPCAAWTGADRCGHQRQGGEAGGQQCRLRHRTVPLPEEAHARPRTLGLPQDVQGMVNIVFLFFFG